MESTIILTLAGVLIAWVATFFAIRRWGPGLARHSLLCPEKEVPARVTFERKEGSFGSLKVIDVTECSLFPEAPVTCHRHCMS